MVEFYLAFIIESPEEDQRNGQNCLKKTKGVIENIKQLKKVDGSKPTVHCINFDCFMLPFFERGIFVMRSRIQKFWSPLVDISSPHSIYYRLSIQKIILATWKKYAENGSSIFGLVSSDYSSKTLTELIDILTFWENFALLLRDPPKKRL